MPDATKRQQLVMKAEGTPGTAEVLESGGGLAANAEMILASEITFDPDVGQIARAAMGASFDTAGSVTGARMGKISFKSNLRGRTAAFSASVLPDNTFPLRACGCSVTMSGGAGSEIVTVAPVSTISTWYTVGFYNDGRLYRLAGALGNVKLTFKRGEPILAEYEMLGAYVAPSDVALRTSGLATTTPAPPPFLGAAVSILAYATPRIDTMTVDLGNELMMRGDPNATSGVLTAMLVGRLTKGSLDPEAVAVATKNYWSEWLADTTGSITTGTFPSSGVQYNKLNFTAPKAKPIKIGKGDREGLAVNPYDFECQKNTDTGDDCFSLVFS